jgi:hypothetical protein
MRPRTCGPLLLVSLLFVSSCNDSGHSTRPTALISTASFSVGATSQTAIAQRVNDFRCPTISPFSVPIVVVVQSNSAEALVVTEMRLQFVDSSGARMPQVTLPAPLPTTQFGTALAETRAAQSFPITLGIGCDTGHTGNLVIIVDTRDALGHRGSGQTTVMVH